MLTLLTLHNTQHC